jgi:hypothetical protein
MTVEALIALRREGKYYLVKTMTDAMSCKAFFDEENGSVEIRDDTSQIAVRCVGEDRADRQWKIEAAGLASVYASVLEQKQRTGSKIPLVIDVDKGEWLTYNLNELKDKVPELSKILTHLDERKYIA